MNKTKKLFPEIPLDTDLVAKATRRHPIFKAADEKKFEYAMAYFCGLKKSPNDSSSQSYKIVSTQVMEYICRLNEKLEIIANQPGFKIYLDRVNRRAFIVGNDIQKLYDNLYNIVYGIASYMPRRKVAIRGLVEDISSLGISLQNIRKVKGQVYATCREVVTRRLETENISFKSLTNILEGDSSDIFNVELMATIKRWSLPSNWYIEYDMYENQILIKYKKAIRADNMYKKDDDGSSHPIKYPYFLYDVRLRYSGSGDYSGCDSRGYHPNLQNRDHSYPHKYIKNKETLCLGELEILNLKTLYKDTNGNNLFYKMLDSLVIMVKSVNLGSAFWSPKPDLFLDKYQEYLDEKKPRKKKEKVLADIPSTGFLTEQQFRHEIANEIRRANGATEALQSDSLLTDNSPTSRHHTETGRYTASYLRREIGLELYINGLQSVFGSISADTIRNICSRYQVTVPIPTPIPTGRNRRDIVSDLHHIFDEIGVNLAHGEDEDDDEDNGYLALENTLEENNMATLDDWMDNTHYVYANARPQIANLITEWQNARS